MASECKEHGEEGLAVRPGLGNLPPWISVLNLQNGVQQLFLKGFRRYTGLEKLSKCKEVIRKTGLRV